MIIPGDCYNIPSNLQSTRLSMPGYYKIKDQVLSSKTAKPWQLLAQRSSTGWREFKIPGNSCPDRSSCSAYDQIHGIVLYITKDCLTVPELYWAHALPAMLEMDWITAKFVFKKILYVKAITDK